MTNLCLSVDTSLPANSTTGAVLEESNELVKVIQDDHTVNIGYAQSRLVSLLDSLVVVEDASVEGDGSAVEDVDMGDDGCEDSAIVPTSSAFVSVCNILLPYKRKSEHSR